MSDAFTDTETAPETVPPVGEAMETVGGVVSVATALDTMTDTGADVVELPAASNATAVSDTAPFAIDVEFHENWNGEAVSVATNTPFTRRSTRVTPTLSDALIVTARRPDTVPPAGDVIKTVGGVVSAVGADAASCTAAAAFTRPAPK